MPLRRALGLTAATAVAVLGLPAPAIAAGPPTTLYVDNTRANCSDKGPGTQAQPYCTIFQAAQVVEPGQTVEVGGQNYGEHVVLTRSGTPDKPITFVGTRWGDLPWHLPRIDGDATAITVSGAHDVVVRGFYVTSRGSDAAVVTNSHQVTLDQNYFYKSPAGFLSVRVTRGSDHITVSRNGIRTAGGVGVDPGSHDVVVTTNEFLGAYGGVSATDAPGLIVTSNTLAAVCGPSIALNGASPNAVIENNIATGAIGYTGPGGQVEPSCGTVPGGTGDVEIAVGAGSTAGTKIDYNLVHPVGGAAYSWGDTRHQSPGAFAAATGQAGHDVDQDVAFAGLPNRLELTDADTAAIDSADPDAPGILPTDLTGRPSIDSPLVPNAPGSNGRDRGARELQGLKQVSLAVNGSAFPSPQGPAPLTVKATASAENTWPTGLTYSFDFLDGTAPVVTSVPSATHTYTAVGTYRPVVTVTDGLGGKVTGRSGTGATVNAPGPLVPGLSIIGSNLSYRFDGTGSTTPYRVKSFTVDFGDGTVSPASPYSVEHTYARAGRYTVTLTVTDEGGRTAGTSEVLDATVNTWWDETQGQRIRILAQTAGETLNANANYGTGRWSGFSRLRWPEPDRPATALAEAYTTNGSLHAFKIYNGLLETADWSAYDRLWSEWQPVSLAGVGQQHIVQVATAKAGDRIHVLVLTANGRVYQAVADYPAGRWSSWGDVTAAAGLPGQITQIGAGFAGNVLHVAALGADGRVRIADGDYNKGTWWSGDLNSYLGGPAGANQLAATMVGDAFHVLTVAGGNVYQAAANYTTGSWNGWGNVSAVTGLAGGVSRLAATSTGNSLRLYAISGGHVYDAAGDYDKGAWSRWADITAPGAAGPQAPVFVLAAAGTG
ncbi:PKD domain-containing protein [Kitasatospora sp. NPDC088351]|uniref:PKD domain-containing protein n=1 Tax=Kitasatospora sp. NPDC088351 TaxID=3155180 RepID=UPI00343E579F